MPEPISCLRGGFPRRIRLIRSVRRTLGSVFLLLGAVVSPAVRAPAQEATGQVAGVVRDGFNAMTLPAAPVTLLSTGETVHTELDGAFAIGAPAGPQEIRVSFSGYEAVVVPVEVEAGATTRLEVALTMERFAEEVVVTGEAVEPELFTAEAQLVERRKASAISDNLASEEMKRNADSNAASAMKRVTGLTVVDNQYVFVRGLGERYSNTTLNGAVLPTTEPRQAGGAAGPVSDWAHPERLGGEVLPPRQTGRFFGRSGRDRSALVPHGTGPRFLDVAGGTTPRLPSTTG